MSQLGRVKIQNVLCNEPREPQILFNFLQWFLKMAGSAKVEEDEFVEKMGGLGMVMKLVKISLVNSNLGKKLQKLHILDLSLKLYII